MMKRVTSVEQQAKLGSKRLNIFLDGKYAFSLVEDLAARLRPGDYLSDEEIAELQTQDDIQQVYEAALNLLSYRPRSVSELKGRLERKGHDPEMIEEVLAKLERQGIIGDELFARFWVENRQAHSPRGGRMLRMELRYKGVDRETIEEALPDEAEEDQAALKVARAKVRSLKGLEWLEFRRRLGDYLARRGFSYETAREITKQVWAEEQGASAGEEDFVEVEALQDTEEPREGIS